MANKKKEYYKPGLMTKGKRNIIQGLLQECCRLYTYFPEDPCESVEDPKSKLEVALSHQVTSTNFLITCRTIKPGIRISAIALNGSFNNLMNIPFPSDF